MEKTRLQSLLQGPVTALNVGLPSFAETLRAQASPTLHLQWRPAGEGQPEVAWALAQLMSDPSDAEGLGGAIDRANEEAVGRILAARPLAVDLVKARDVWPQTGRRLLHAGPPITWQRMCGPMRGAVLGAMLFEGWAASPEEATALMEADGVELAPCHHYAAVAPMAGVISPSMSLWVVRNDDHGNVAYSNLNEGLGKVLRFGAYSPEVVQRLHWMEDVLAPLLRRALGSLKEGIDLKAILAQALQMGDDGHNRNNAATSLLFRQLTLAVLAVEPDATRAREALAFVDANNHTFLNLSMAAAKATLDAAQGVERSTVVTAMSRNGVDFGIRVSGLGDRWFTAPAPVPEGLYFPGYGAADANPDMGDSAITETAGVGGFAMGAAPAMVQFVGGTPEDALGYTREMMEITLARNNGLALPPLGFVGTPTGIDVRKVLDTGIAPAINTGIAHREAGVGQVGAGIARAPLACFEQALLALAEELGVKVG
ncbi:MAG: YlbE family protein [Chloroflexota bacterium]